MQKGVVNLEEFLQSEILSSTAILSTDIEATLEEKSLANDGDLSNTANLVERELGRNQVATSAITWREERRGNACYRYVKLCTSSED